MITFAPAEIQIPRFYNEFGILAHSDTYAVDYGRIVGWVEEAPAALPTEAEVIAKVEKGEKLTEAENKVMVNRPVYSIFRQVRQGWTPVETVKGEVMLGRKMAHLMASTNPGQTNRYRAKTTGGDWIYF